jgi:purine-binding chemotaxis protein CheW
MFSIRSQVFGIPLSDTLECFRLPAISPLPGAPNIIEGVVNIRGEAVPVFNLAARCGLPNAKPHASQFLLLALAGTRRAALRVDQVIGIESIDESGITPPEKLSRSLRRLRGVVALEGNMVLIHDLADFLESSEEDALDRALSDGEGKDR